jgi:hypothetical protein
MAETLARSRGGDSHGHSLTAAPPACTHMKTLSRRARMLRVTSASCWLVQAPVPFAANDTLHAHQHKRARNNIAAKTLCANITQTGGLSAALLLLASQEPQLKKLTE